MEYKEFIWMFMIKILEISKSENNLELRSVCRRNGTINENQNTENDPTWLNFKH